MDQVDIFGLVDEVNVLATIHYMDAEGFQHTETINTPKDEQLASVQKWREAHPQFYFLFFT